MGTRSILAVENKPGSYHCQYQQFDGYPTCKGGMYYQSIVAAMGEDREYFADKERPKAETFTPMVMRYLNWQQYATGHSINEHWEIPAADWYSLDCWQEWQYLFKLDGSFDIVDHGYKERPNLVWTLPWDLNFILILANTSLRYYQSGSRPDKTLDALWAFFQQGEPIEKILPLALEVDHSTDGSLYALRMNGIKLPLSYYSQSQRHKTSAFEIKPISVPYSVKPKKR